MRVLLVEDERTLAGDYALVLLDPMLPGKGGLEVLDAVRARKPELPVIVLTSQGAIEHSMGPARSRPRARRCSARTAGRLDPRAAPRSGIRTLWQWPQFAATFSLGGLAAWGVIAATVAATGTDFDVALEPGFHWASLAMAAVEGPLAVGASLWLLGIAQRGLKVLRARWGGPSRAVPTAGSFSRGSGSIETK